MRCWALLAVLVLPACSGSGFWRYERDSFTLPWQNPNAPISSSENFVRARHGSKVIEAPVMLTEAGDVWPGPPAPVPTLKDLQKQQLAEINNDNAVPGEGLAPLPALPSLPGFEISNQDPKRVAPTGLFNGGVVGMPGGRSASTNYGSTAGSLPMVPPTAPNGDIIVPNGNGTSTVISPNGKVTTIPTRK